MSIIMKRVFNIKGDYNEYEKSVLQKLVDMFRLSIGDDDPERNILFKKTQMYSDDKILSLLFRAVSDLNGGVPQTTLTIFEIARDVDDSLIVDGAIIFALIAEGIVQTRNQLNYSDSGLQIGMFDKTQLYQGWISMLMSTYFQNKQAFKETVLTKHSNTFYGIESEFSRYWWG